VQNLFKSELHGFEIECRASGSLQRLYPKSPWWSLLSAEVLAAAKEPARELLQYH
jgi:hypothetical protein